MRDTPVAADAVGIFATTFPREGEFLLGLDLADLARGVTAARGVTCPVRFLLGERSPTWAATVTHTLAAALPDATVTPVPGHGYGHDLVDSAPATVLDALVGFLS